MFIFYLNILYFILFFVLLNLFIVSKGDANNDLPCLPRHFKYDSVVCVCNVSYCDTVPTMYPLPSNGDAVIYTSSKDGQRLVKTFRHWSTDIQEIDTDAVNITVDFTKKFQKIDGFGGAFTDAAGINIASLPLPVQSHLIDSYFSEKGIEYNIGRIPMASCDFSTRNYSYADIPNDFNLKHFALVEEDLLMKIPFIKAAIGASKRKIKFISSPWSAPYWMKTNQAMDGRGTLIGQPGGKYYKTWANYFIRFLEEYAKHGIEIWAVTAENEPTNGLMETWDFQALGFTPEMQRDFLKFDLIPAVLNSTYKNVEIMILDDRRFLLPKWAEIVLKDPYVAKYAKYIALHWYTDDWAPIELLEETHEILPNAALIGTEACNGVHAKNAENVKLGDWERAQSYAQNIIETLNSWYTGWIDWNLALNLQGGPNWVKNFVDSPIIVNSSANEFYKQPMFYAMGHFSKFIPEGSVRVFVEKNFNNMDKTNILVTSFRASNYNVIVILNKYNNTVKLRISEKYKKPTLTVQMSPKSIQTIIWR